MEPVRRDQILNRVLLTMLGAVAVASLAVTYATMRFFGYPLELIAGTMVVLAVPMAAWIALEVRCVRRQDDPPPNGALLAMKGFRSQV